MNTDAQIHELAASGLAQPHSDDWWRNRTADELRDLINRGFAGGDLFTGATAEAERRMGEVRKLADEEAAAASMERHRHRRRILVLRILVGLSLLATLFMTVVVFTHIGAE